MTAERIVKQLLRENQGWLTSKEILDLGVSKYEFYRAIQEMELERAGHGIYVSADVWPDSMYLIHLRSAQAVFSHETALFLHDMTDREPSYYSVTVKTGYNPHRLKQDGIKVYTIMERLHGLGLSEVKTPFGHTVPVYDIERTLCDILRSRSSVEIQVFLDALKSYARLNDKNLRVLMQYAEAFHVRTILKPYLEVLL
ncbi:MAG TPA: type IV toxin-antitoxin system AbiEi family antitoxin domain-containing protein [Myxococcota bacterium]|nr:type IV toxin-antitoxin system AbiEi family antitoxin domain-containing protein [Myxococcota bacterium]HON25362.1 type IV toxin-antitoxin system AbiEi family antitoxin domain-containing protein [Myxococcota bacterium]HOS62899.1 type IV toxin-antitoxin system AbiEi family antitoxin domain-containing protein [Myxococcota bacterium]HPC92893.1 type IV toxin-antitoxin system AbiEi family antitoxin domain-containing protein [Myxococcota bacterium]HPL24850.1 type IV toxin-antitoxin system AbiEi fam